MPVKEIDRFLNRGGCFFICFSVMLGNAWLVRYEKNDRKGVEFLYLFTKFAGEKQEKNYCKVIFNLYIPRST